MGVIDEFLGDTSPAAPRPRARYDAPENVDALRRAATDLGIDPIDLATVISYETGGTFDPDQPGPTTKWGQHRGLIQFGGPQRQKYGVVPGQSIPEQLPAVVAYLRDAGVKPGMGIMDVYSAINAGGVGRYDRSDAAAGGAPGTVADKVNYQMGDHRRKAEALFAGGGGGTGGPAMAASPIDGFLDAEPVAAAPASAPVAAEDPGYLGGVADAIGNLFTGDQPILSRIGAVQRAAEPDIVRGVRARAAELGGSVVRGIANVAEPVGDFLETSVPLSGLSPDQIQNERQLQPLYDLSDALGGYAEDNRYAPSASFQDVKDDPLSMATPTFIAEQAALSAPDMAASVLALPAYMLGRTEEIGERRVELDGRTGEPGLGDLGAAAPGAVIESLLERYATKRLPGAAPGGSAAGNVVREAAVQAGTEGLEEGAANLAESVGTERGVDIDEFLDAAGSGALVGGGLGAGVRAATEAVDAVRGKGAIDDFLGEAAPAEEQQPGAVAPTSPEIAEQLAAPQQENAQPAPQQASEPVDPVTAATPAVTEPPVAAAPTEQAEPTAEPAAPVEATKPGESSTGLGELGGAAKAISDNFYQGWFDRLSRKDGSSSAFKAERRWDETRAAFDRGEIKTVDDLKAFLNAESKPVDAEAAPPQARRAEEIEAARMLELRTKRRAESLTPQESDELVTLMERDAHAAKVAGRRIQGVQNMAARDELEQAGALKPVQAFADADDFKSFNDQMGHDVGDSVIRTLGQEFSAVLGDGNVFHRGGDEFVLQADSPEQMTAAMDAVRSKLSEAEFVMTTADGTVITRKGVGFSYGVGANIQEAENAQYQDKSARKAAGLRTGARDATPAPANANGADPRSGAVDRAESGESRAADARRPAEAVERETAPLLESINDRSAVPDEQEDAEVDGEDAAPRETVELEDRIESAGERNTRKKGASDEFMRASFTNRRSWAQAAYRDAGLDPDAAELLPVDKQFEAAATALKNKFGLTAQKTPKALGRMAVDNALDLYRNAQTMAHVLGLPEKAVGLGDTLTLLFRGDAPYLGAMYPKGGKVEGVDLPAGAIALPGRSNSFAHEWGHALDLYLAGKYGMDGMVTRNVRNDGIDAQPDTSREAFANLMNAMFFGEAALAARVMALQQMATNGTDRQQAAAKQALEKIAKGNSKLKIDGSKYLIESKAFGASAGGKAGAKYFGDAAEMMARAFEAYVAEKVEAAGGSTEVLAKGDSAYLSNTDDRFAKTFPKLDERLKIFAAFDDLFGQLAKEQLVAQGVAASNPGNIDTFDPRLWLQDTGKPQNYRGIAGAWREQVDDWNAARERSRRAKQRPADPVSRKARIQNALMAWTTPIQGVFRVMEARYPKSKAMRELANKLVTAPGVNRVVDRVYEQAVRITMGRGYNQFGNIVDRYQLNKLSDADRITLRRLLVSAQDPGRAPQELVKAAAELRRFMDTLWYDNQEAGINIGYTKNGYLPRMMDMAMVQADPEAFVKAATEAYAIQLENDEMVEPEEVGETAEKMARAWLHNMLSAPAMDFASKSPAENYTKHRSLPAEADVLLEKFYVNDPLEVIHRYIGMSAKNTEFATMFGPKGEQLNDLFAQMAGEGVSLEDQKYLQGTVNSLMGRQSPGVLDGKPRAQALMNQVNAYGVMSMLGRVLISSIAEPGMAGIRTGSAAAVYKPYFNLMKQVIGTADMKQWREITRAIGLIGDAQADMVVQARLGGTYESTPKTDARLARYFALTGLHALTNAQRVSLMPVTHQYLGQLVNQVKTGSAAEMKEGRALLAELGIDNANEFDIGKSAPAMTELFDKNGRETEFGAKYMTAMSRINEQIVQAPNRYDRPEMANSPTGRFLYGIMSFNLAFWNNVYKREANVLKRHATGKGVLGGAASVTGYVGGHMVPPLMAYFFTQMLVTAAREALLNPQRWEEWDRDDELVQKLTLLTLSRAFPAGLFDIPIQAYQSLKYQRDITSIAVGAVPSYFLMSLQKVVAAFREENSDDTNNAEFGAMQGAYQLLANPLIAHVLTSLPGGRLLDPIYGVGLAVGTSAAARDTTATAAVGERDSLVAKRKRDERKAAGGVESAGDRGSSRGSVRNGDQRGSTR